MILKIFIHSMALMCSDASDLFPSTENLLVRKDAKESFKIDEAEIIEIATAWQKKCEEEKNLASHYFFESGLNLNEVKSFNPNIKKKILSIDLGGSSLKIGVVEFKESRKYIPSCNLVKIFKYQTESNESPINTLEWQDWVASKIKKYIDENGISVDAGALTFSYAVKSESIIEGKIHSVGKNWPFIISQDMYQKGIVESLNHALAKENLPFSVKCLANDVIATYLSGYAYGYNNHISVIVGTGTNGGFIIKKRNGSSVLVNSEWSRAKVPNSILTEADRAILELLPEKVANSAIFEILTAGFKFIEIIQEEMKLLLGEDFVVDIDRISEVFYKDNILLPSDLILKDVILSFKKRSYKMISALVISSIKCSEIFDFDIITNGTAFNHEKDINIFNDCMQNVLDILKSNNLSSQIYYNQLKYRLEHHNEASLVGVAFIGNLCLENEKIA